MTATHTPGPWGNESHSMGQVVVVTDARGMTIARMTLHAVKEAEANARLMAASPELLDAAIDLLWKLEGMAVHESHYAALKSAIFKATGSQA